MNKTSRQKRPSPKEARQRESILTDDWDQMFSHIKELDNSAKNIADLVSDHWPSKKGILKSFLESLIENIRKEKPDMYPPKRMDLSKITRWKRELSIKREKKKIYKAIDSVNFLSESGKEEIRNIVEREASPLFSKYRLVDYRTTGPPGLGRPSFEEPHDWLVALIELIRYRLSPKPMLPFWALCLLLEPLFPGDPLLPHSLKRLVGKVKARAMEEDALGHYPIVWTVLKLIEAKVLPE